ncbi:MAG: helix-turn-helix domain-containing protein [Alphaproteobacteria bacterium]|jgi:transcriptional regulator with XRE-family HTH domain|nr:helix-turn-helix domain-containing protein [Alphaproteobacteria bacterium]
MSELRNIRRTLGLTQGDLASAMNTTGVSISRYERDERKLTLPLLRRLSSVLSCSITDIIGDGIEDNTLHGSRSGVRWLKHYKLDQYQDIHGKEENSKELPPEIPAFEDLITELEAAGNSDLIVIHMVNCGDAMSPLLEENDLVLLDRSVSNFSRNGVYLILSGDQPEFRRLAKNPVSQCFSVITENPNHPDYDNVSLEKLKILWIAVGLCSRI